MSRFCALFSGSSGNCTYIGEGNTHILIDAGVSARRISCELSNIGIEPNSISAIFVTHEHNDHICGLHTFAKKHNVPIFMSQGTAEALEKLPNISCGLNINVINGAVDLGDIEVQRFATSHDCDGSSGFRIKLGYRDFAVCTDTGIVTDEIRTALKGCELVLLESNHDINMLNKGPYPPSLKRRILSNTGHLSNASCAEELPKLLKSGTIRFILGHLSRQNNTPKAAYDSANSILTLSGFTEGMDYMLNVAPPSGGKLISL